MGVDRRQQRKVSEGLTYREENNHRLIDDRGFLLIFGDFNLFFIFERWRF